MLVGVLSMGIMNIFVKIVNQNTDLNVFQVCFWRFLIMAIGSSVHARLIGVGILDV
jgi:hypothetical protein